jgi:hypothetical protein
MEESSGAHKQLRQEWVETPPDVSYRFVVSPGTLRAAEPVARAVSLKKRSWRQRAMALFVKYVLGSVVGAPVIVLFGWLALQPAIVVYRALDVTQRPASAVLLAIATFLATFLGLFGGVLIVSRYLIKLSFQRFYREFYADNEFVLEGRQSHLWFDEQSAGAIRRWSTFEQLVEFDEGMWLFLRRRRTFAGLRGILISKESLPNSCNWNELQTYLTRRIEEAARHDAGVQKQHSTGIG